MPLNFRRRGQRNDSESAKRSHRCGSSCKLRASSAAFLDEFIFNSNLAFTGFCRVTARPSNCEASSSSGTKIGWKTRERSGRIARNKSQRTLAIERLKTIEELAGDFQIRFHSEPHQNQIVHFIRRSNRQGRRPYPGDSKVRRSLPNWQTADGALLEALVTSDRSELHG